MIAVNARLFLFPTPNHVLFWDMNNSGTFLQQIRMAEIEQASLKSEQLSDKSSSPALPDDLSLDEHTAYQLLARESTVGMSRLKTYTSKDRFKNIHLFKALKHLYNTCTVYQCQWLKSTRCPEYKNRAFHSFLKGKPNFFWLYVRCKSTKRKVSRNKGTLKTWTQAIFWRSSLY